MTVWQKRKLSDLADMCLGKMLDQNKNKGEFLPYLANINVRWGSIDLDNLREMRFEEREFERYGLKYGDIVMCEGGEPGRCAIWKNQTPSMMIQKALHRISAKEGIDSFFLYYALLNKGLNGHFSGFFTGAAIKHLTGESLTKIELDIPPLPVQQKIAGILSAYDDLIENNLERIKLLEEMAQITYEEWFVRLRFPGHESIPITPETGLPEGWAIKKLGEVTALIKRGISPQYVESGGLTVINQKCVRNHNVNLEVARQTALSKKVPAEKMLKKYDVLINSTGTGTLGRVAQYFFETSPATVDTHVTIVRASENISSLYLGRFLERNEPYLEQLGKGATNQKELSATDIFTAVDIVVPDQSTQEKYFCRSYFLKRTRYPSPRSTRHFATAPDDGRDRRRKL
jgi:type I restriction enzyme, S subunit